MLNKEKLSQRLDCFFHLRKLFPAMEICHVYRIYNFFFHFIVISEAHLTTERVNKFSKKKHANVFFPQRVNNISKEEKCQYNFPERWHLS